MRRGGSLRRAARCAGAATLLLTACTVTDLGDARRAAAECRSRTPVERLLERVLGCAAAGQITVHVVPEPPRPSGWFRVAGSDSGPVVSGSDPSAALAGVNWYLDHVVGVSITWAGSRLELPELLPVPPVPIERSSAVPHRVALNDTSSAYTAPYRTWADWERQLDVLALHGYREVVVTEGQESTYLAAFSELGWDPAALRTWIPLPAHVPWWLMGNLSGGPRPPSAQLLDRRADLGRRIVDRLRELGLTPVLPGYSGMVPPGAADHLPGARIVPQGTWNGTARPDWLDPSTPTFALVAATYYRAQRQLFGATAMVRMDLLHEGGRLGTVDLAAAGRGVERALQVALPGAVWAMLGWQDNPRRALLDALDPATTLVLDGLSDTAYEVDRVADWAPVPYAFGSILGFGGRTTLGGNLPAWVRRFAEAVTAPGSNLRGVAFLPEAAAGNPLAFDLFAELPWNGGRVDLGAWTDEWAAHRYGGPPEGDAHAVRAWRLLIDSVYSGPHGGRSQGADSLYAVRPGLYIGETISFAQPLHYDPGLVLDALEQLLSVPTALRRSDTYRADLADVARQVLDDHARQLLPRIASAVRRRDSSELRLQRARWLVTMNLSAELAGAHEATLLGPWLADAEWLTDDPAEQAALRADARRLLTTWGDRAVAESGLSDYAGRAWAGLADGRYVPRWTQFLDDLLDAIDRDGLPPPRDTYAADEAWIEHDQSLPTTPRGDLVDIARRARATARA